MNIHEHDDDHGNRITEITPESWQDFLQATRVRVERSEGGPSAQLTAAAAIALAEKAIELQVPFDPTTVMLIVDVEEDPQIIIDLKPRNGVAVNALTMLQDITRFVAADVAAGALQSLFGPRHDG